MPKNPFHITAISRPPGVPRKTQFPSPGKSFGKAGHTELVGGPESFIAAHPELFARSSTSRDEGYVYWALLRVLGPEGSVGGWSYQSAVAGGRHLPSGAVVDFVVWARQPAIAIRIQTPRFHIAVGPRLHAYDADQKEMLAKYGFTVVDLFSELFLDDKSGQAVIIQVKEALDGRERQSPITSGASLTRPGAAKF